MVKKRIAVWIQSHLLHVQITLTLLTVIICVVFASLDKQQELLIALLSLIGIDFFVLSIGYLEKTLKNTSSIIDLLKNSGQSDIKLIQRNELDWISAVKDAQHDVFISGTTLHTYVEGKAVLSKIDNISFRIMTLDIGNSDILTSFTKMRYQKGSNQRYIALSNVFKDLYSAVRAKSNFKFSVSDRITPMSFFAVDIQQPSCNTFIRVQHYLHEKEAKEATISYIIKPGCPLFDVVKDQIEILWENSKKSGTYLDAN